MYQPRPPLEWFLKLSWEVSALHQHTLLSPKRHKQADVAFGGSLEGFLQTRDLQDQSSLALAHGVSESRGKVPRAMKCPVVNPAASRSQAAACVPERPAGPAASSPSGDDVRRV